MRLYSDKAVEELLGWDLGPFFLLSRQKYFADFFRPPKKMPGHCPFLPVVNMYKIPCSRSIA